MSVAQLPTCPTFDPEQLNLSDAKPIGSGALSHVVYSKLNTSRDSFIAIKILSKLQLLQQKKVNSVMNEKQALIELGPHPFVVRLFGTAQSNDELYFVMEHLPHGDLLEHLRRCFLRQKAGPNKQLPLLDTSIRCLDFHDIQLITAQLVVGLSHVAKKGFVLRDLKPENVAFDSKYRVCLLDFDTIDLEGSAPLPASGNAAESSGGIAGKKKNEPRRRITVSEIQAIRKKTSNFCGTAQYVSPEMAGRCQWSYSSDLWALGAIVYEMMYGTHMFSGSNAYKVLKRVMMGVSTKNIPFPRVYLGPESDAFERVKDFILRLCCVDPTRRLGVHPVTGQFDEEALRRHQLFGDFSWFLLDEHVNNYRPPTVNAVSQETGSVQAHAALSGPIHSQMLDDGTLSLKQHYHVLPVHDEEYSKYVFEATADANPFERWAQGGAAADSLPEKEDEVGKGDDEVFLNGELNTATVGEEDFDDVDMDVIDDVGMHFFGRAHPDFADSE